MKMDFNLNLTQEQKLIMTQQMQISIKLLQMSSLELLQHVDKELQENPALEVKNSEADEVKLDSRVNHKELIKYLEFDNYNHNSSFKDEAEVSPFNFISNTKSLKEFLFDQILELGIEANNKYICKYIINSIDERGYLDSSLEELSGQLKVEKNQIEIALQIVQSLEPSGIAARDLKECLKIQLRRRNKLNNILEDIIDHHLENIADNKYLIIAKETMITPKEAQQYGDLIKTLEPKPSRGFYTGDETKYIIPDAYINYIGDRFFITMNDKIVPELILNTEFKDILNFSEDKDAVDYIKEKINSALFLMKTISQRRDTIYRVLEKIIELQGDYFILGEEYLRPMTLKEIAEALGLHESTISRAIREKYVYTNRGVVKIKNLFTTGILSLEKGEDISTKSIKNRIKELIEKEDKKKPLSDQEICDNLNESGMNISRRTVAKYREEIGLRSSSKRKRL
jgi:RNA polymerase sigma-54 factor